MRALEFWALAYLFNSLWQIPLLFSAAWLAGRSLRSAAATAEHRVWVIALVLESLVPAVSIVPWKWPGALSLWGWHGGSGSKGQVIVVMGSGDGAGAIPLPGAMLTTIAILYAAVIAYFAARFLWRMGRLSGIRNETATVTLAGEPKLFWVRCSRRFGIEGVSIAASSRISGPLTMGLWRKLLLLPANMADGLPDQELCTVIAHEFAHMQRRDYAKNLLYELISLPVAYHPLLWLTRAGISESREMICDQMAAVMTGKVEYASSLLRLASLVISGAPARTPHTIGILDGNAFERRIMNLAEKQKGIQGAGRIAIMAACAALGLATCGSVVALGMHANAAQVAGGNDSRPPKQLSIPPDVMARNLLTKTMPVYPPAAKKAKIEGTVALRAVISKDGNVESLRVISGPQKLQQSALDAVRQWKYKPYLLNGDPIEVETTVNIVYDLKD